jgi:hypothetical protein
MCVSVRLCVYVDVYVCICGHAHILTHVYMYTLYTCAYDLEDIDMYVWHNIWRVAADLFVCICGAFLLYVCMCIWDYYVCIRVYYMCVCVYKMCICDVWLLHVCMCLLYVWAVCVYVTAICDCYMCICVYATTLCVYYMCICVVSVTAIHIVDTYIHTHVVDTYTHMCIHT